MRDLLLFEVTNERRKSHSRYYVDKAQASKAGVRKRWRGKQGSVAAVQKGLSNKSDSVFEQTKCLFGGGGKGCWPFAFVKPHWSTS